MPSTVTLAYLREQSRATADMQNSNFVTPTELDQYINLACQELYDILVSRFEDYYTEAPITFSATPGSPEVELPEDFYKLRGVDLLVGGGQYVPMRMFTFQERNIASNPILYPNDATETMYRLRKNKLTFTTVDNPLRGRYWYIPAFTRLEEADDEFDGVNGWERYVVVSVAIMMKQKEESDVSVLMVEKEKLNERIKVMAENRDTGSPERVTDVSSNVWGPVRRF